MRPDGYGRNCDTPGTADATCTCHCYGCKFHCSAHWPFWMRHRIALFAAWVALFAVGSGALGSLWLGLDFWVVAGWVGLIVGTAFAVICARLAHQTIEEEQ